MIGSDDTMMQHTFMMNLVCPQQKKHLETLLTHSKLCEDGGDYRNVCEWKGVKCTDDNIVNEIRWVHVAGKTIDIRWLPPLMTYVGFDEIVPLERRLSTRHLPRSLIKCRMVTCSFRGSLDLRCLPERLKELHLGSNKFNGVVDLTNLPETLTHIYLDRNTIDAVLVTNTRLPKSLVRARFFRNPAKMEILCTDAVTVDPRVTTKLVTY
eukprot:CAMPEP_0201532348 /NCGR_PEP_ID=MMETSP0161_2-20130828/50152_1 /ASSEMBLY_ACC=CAM_ASM_000251 /TAXON_ID=180227 /ORGANISM="Neoparamoeba aestuarina, Strain SoJaBio B1-5/56/2" /LENGTH=208 /DNA_ID=CAMNT_0047935717 /DNA_START=44 /DNA_END=670 /DNA_ORIENTATION=+